MSRFDSDERSSGYMDHSEYSRELLLEKDRIIDLQERDMVSLKREMVSLKKQLNRSKRKKES